MRTCGRVEGTGIEEVTKHWLQLRRAGGRRTQSCKIQILGHPLMKSVSKEIEKKRLVK